MGGKGGKENDCAKFWFGIREGCEYEGRKKVAHENVDEQGKSIHCWIADGRRRKTTRMRVKDGQKGSVDCTLSEDGGLYKLRRRHGGTDGDEK